MNERASGANASETGPAPVGQRLRVLIVEDNPSDALLMEIELTRAGFDVESERVSAEPALVAALVGHEWDVVLADYKLPAYSGLEALDAVTKTRPDLPLILVSGAIDVPTALGAVNAGARDFVLKDDLKRLPSIISRELADTERRAENRRVRLERDRALEAQHASHERLELLVRVFGTLPTSGLVDEECISDLLSQLIDVFSADGAAIVVLAEEGPGQSVDAGDLAGAMSEIDAARHLVDTVTAQNATVFVGDTHAGSAGATVLVDEARSLLGVPMRRAGTVMGVLVFAWRVPFEPPPWMFALVEIAADHFALAMENARLYQLEHRIADTLQQALLSIPNELPGLDVACFYKSATEHALVGGDFYDVFETDPGCIAVVIGDVSGKGIGAAGTTALVKNALRAHLMEGDSASEAMTKANRLVYRFTTPEMFVTAFVGVLDVATWELSYASAGHPCGLTVGATGSATLDQGGPLLGAFADVQHAESTRALLPEETLVLFTDGLIEARNPEGDFFGEQRLRDLLQRQRCASPDQVVAFLLSELREFSADRLRDDVAVLALRRSGVTCIVEGETPV